jgi:5'-3' exonuclease
MMPIHRSLNHDFFKKWSPEMAYVLGFITADGNLNVGRRGNCYLEINSTDKDILEKIKSALDSDHLVSSRKRHRKWKQSFRIQIEVK